MSKVEHKQFKKAQPKAKTLIKLLDGQQSDQASKKVKKKKKKKWRQSNKNSDTLALRVNANEDISNSSKKNRNKAFKILKRIKKTLAIVSL